MLKKSHLFISLIFLLSFNGFSQTPQTISASHDEHKINSKILNESRQILVRTPADYEDGNSKYPVLYMLDAHPPHNALMVGMVEQQAASFTMPEMIVVGIQNTNRSRDMSPTVDAKNERQGGDKFLEFVEKEVMPLVEKNYRTENYKVFAGWSSGGLMVISSFVNNPDLFDAYISVSPYLEYEENFIIKKAEKLFSEKRDFNKTLFLGVGNEPYLMKSLNEFEKLLNAKKPKNLEYEFEVFPKENHDSAVLPTYYEGLRKVFENWYPSEINSFADIENHYKKLSEKYDFEVKIPEVLLNRTAYNLMFAEKPLEAEKAFRKNIELYPNSLIAYRQLGGFFERTNKLGEAQETYEKALKIAVQKKDERFINIFKISLERILKKSK